MGDSPNTKVLSLLSTVSGESISKSLNKILPSLIISLYSKIDPTNPAVYADELENCKQVLLSVTDEGGFRLLIDELLGVMSKQTALGVPTHVFATIANTTTYEKGGTSDKAGTSDKGAASDKGGTLSLQAREYRLRAAGVMLVTQVCASTGANWQTYLTQILKGLITLFAVADPFLLEQVWLSLDTIIKKMDSPLMIEHVSSLRQALRFALLNHKSLDPLPGLSLNKVFLLVLFYYVYSVRIFKFSQLISL